MLSVEKYEKIMSYWQEIQKSDLVNRVNRGIRHNIRKTKYYDMARTGSYTIVISKITGKGTDIIHSYLTSYNATGVYKYKFPLWYLAKIAEAFDIAIEYFIGITDSMQPTCTAEEYLEVYELYNNTDKMVVVTNLKVLRGCRELKNNTDIGRYLGISVNTVKANFSSGKSVRKNYFTLDQLYKLAKGFDVKIDDLLKEVV